MQSPKTYRGVTVKTDTGSFQRCTMKGQEAVVTNVSTVWKSEKKLFITRMVKDKYRGWTACDISNIFKFHCIRP